MEVVQEAWHEEVPGISPLNILFFELQQMTSRLKQWSKSLFCNAWIELHMSNEIIHRLDMAQNVRQLSPEECELRQELKSRVFGLAAVKHARRQQVSRII
jgi:hypothetical protein